MATCSTSPDHPPAVAHIRLFAELAAQGTPRRLDNLCAPCTKAALEEHAPLVTSGAVASVVILSINALPNRCPSCGTPNCEVVHKCEKASAHTCRPGEL